MNQHPYQLNTLSVKQIDPSIHKLLLNYFPQENESFLHFVWILNIFVFIFVCRNNLNFIIMTMTNNLLLIFLKDIKNNSIAIEFTLNNGYGNYIIDITYDETDNSIGMSTRGSLSGANWYEDTPEEHQMIIDYLHLEDDDVFKTRLINN